MGLRSWLNLLRSAYLRVCLSCQSFRTSLLLRHTKQKALISNFQIL